MATIIAPSNSRGMGWRKPVPVYIPTPPSSRPTSDTLFMPASVVPGGDAGKGPTLAAPEDRLPPMPENWLNIVRSVSHDFYGDSNRFHLTPGTGMAERPLVAAGVFRTASSMDDHRPPSSRSNYVQRGVFPRVYRPPTPPIPSVKRPRSCAIPNMLEQQTSLGRPYRMIYPDPPSLLMKTSHQTLCRSPSPSLCMSETTRMPKSVKAKPSLQSIVSSEDHTVVSSHDHMDLGSWYIPDDLRAEWDFRLGLDRHNEKQIQMVAVAGDTGMKGKPELPMHYIPASKLRKKQRQNQRSCSDMLWHAISSAGRAIASLFKTDPVESGPAAPL